ncbi:MAG: glycosyltransferase [Bacteroidia bacterium]|nr:glycosyltransferase [Bacteroidia bacterium]MCZ2276510.1 glycosyltransferase [Bacteroidia bacterium]
MQKTKVLYCVLNWGLGHATRSIPVINELMNQGAEVIIASDGEALSFLSNRFPQLQAAVLPSYNIRYASSSMVLEMIRSLPKILNTIRKEKLVTEKIIAEYEINRIISDNRYGCYHPSVYSAFITHQIALRGPAGLKWSEPLLFLLHKRRIQKFRECWIPDFEGDSNLSGRLSHGHHLSAASYIGLLSHLELPDQTVDKSIPLLVICSGPEPARTRFEKKLSDELRKSTVNAVLVRGSLKPSETNHPENVQVIDMCRSKELASLIKRSDMIVSRSGYSTIMDLVKLNKKAVFIPTPGQTEQEYLAAYHLAKGNFYSVPERKFSLSAALKNGSAFTPFKMNDNNLLTEKIKAFLQ